MRRDPLFLLWAVRCPSPEDCRRLQQWLAPLVAPEATFVDEVRVFTEGTETTRREPHRLGDYFESVEVLPPAERSPASFRLLFRRLAAAGRFWKDLMVRLLQKVRDEAAGTTTTLEYQGDEEPAIVADHGETMSTTNSSVGAFPLLEGDVVVTLMPSFDKTSENLTKFRWNMQIPLPFPFPARKCVKQAVNLDGKPFSFEIHNHYDRVTQFIQPPGMPPIIRAFLLNRGTPTPPPPQNCRSMNREPLKSVAFFDGLTDYASYEEAVAGSAQTMEAGFQYLASYLAACQRDAPYLSAWLVYPVSLFEVRNAFQEVRAYCTTHKAWHLFSSGLQFSFGRNLQQPTFFIDPPTNLEAASPVDTANELLAEGMMALYRGVSRLTVLNSYGAVEWFANAVYSKVRIAQYIADGVPEKYAEQFAEYQRQKNNTDVSFLCHRGLKEACGRSLADENKQLYDALIKFKQVRNQVAHAGYKPTFDEAQKGHKLCCEAVQWLAGLGGFPVKPLVPEPEPSGATIIASVATCSR